MKNSKNSNSIFFNIGEDFIPYASHISKDTIITKNAQILQTIKINNFNHKEVNDQNPTQTLRELIRSAIKKNIQSPDFAFWIHTVRRKTDLTKFCTAEEPYFKSIFDNWSKYYELNEQFVNELYVTVIRKGPKVQDKQIATKHFTHNKLKNFIFEELDVVQNELSSVVDGMLLDLAYYNPIKLSVVEEDGISYSQNIEFFHKIFNLVNLKSEVQEADISSVLNLSQMELLPNSINIKNNYAQHSIATLTLKHYLETDVDVLDKVLSLPFEFIIYQAFDFINTEDVLSKYHLQYKMLKVSKDYTFMKQLGLNEEEFEEEKQNKGTTNLNYGESQIGVIIIADNQEMLTEETAQLVSILEDTGFVFIRDDVAVENTFFSSVPANFSFLRRMQPIQTSKVAGFASIDNYPSGKLSGSIWGECITIFRALDGASYFFNFHCDEKGGHTLVLGAQNNSYQHSLINFLIANSLKLGVRVLNIDFNESTKLFNAFIGGKYKTLSNNKEQNTLKINPSNFFKNAETCNALLDLCLKKDGKATEGNLKYAKEKLTPFIQNYVGEINSFADLLSFIKNEKIISVFFSSITKEGIFDAVEDDISSLKAGEVLSIDITASAEDEQGQAFVFRYLLMQIKELVKDKQKTIIKIDYFLSVCLNIGMEKKEITELLLYLKQHNAILIIEEDYGLFDEYKYEEEGDAKIMSLISNEIYMPAFAMYSSEEFSVSVNYVKNVSRLTKLTPKEEAKITKYSHNSSVFLLKHAGKLVALEFNENFSPTHFFFMSNIEIEGYFLETIKSAPNFESKLKEATEIYKILFKKNENK